MKYLICLILALSSVKLTAQVRFDKVGKPIKVTVYLYETRSDMMDAYKEATGSGEAWRTSNMHGWSMFTKSSDYCDIHVVKMRSRRVYHETMGHELRHCFSGEWHRP